MNVGWSFLRNFVLVALSMACGHFVRENPLLFGWKASSMPLTAASSSSSLKEHNNNNTTNTSSSSPAAAIITSHPVLDAVLKHHEADFMVRGDYDAYRNHCLRIMNFAVNYHEMEHQNCQSPPSTARSDQEKTAAAAAAAAATPAISMTEHELNVVALALAYHDIGLWTDGGSLAYTEPSVAVMEREIYVAGGASGQKKNRKQHGWMATASLPVFTLSDLATAREIILQQHKFTSWQPPAKVEPDESTTPVAAVVDAVLVNAVRRAGWADVTMGVVRSGMSAEYLETVYNAIPTHGFHAMLLRMYGPLVVSPHTLWGQLDILKMLKW